MSPLKDLITNERGLRSMRIGEVHRKMRERGEIPLTKINGKNKGIKREYKMIKREEAFFRALNMWEDELET